MPCFNKLLLPIALALVACSTITSALPAYEANKSVLLAARSADNLPRSLAEKLIRIEEKRASLKRNASAIDQPQRGKRAAKEAEKGKPNPPGPPPPRGPPSTPPGHGPGKPGNGPPKPPPGPPKPPTPPKPPGPPRPRPNDPQNCGRPGRVCSASYNGIGQPRCKQGMCTLKCPGGTKPRTTPGGLVYCA